MKKNFNTPASAARPESSAKPARAIPRPLQAGVSPALLTIGSKWKLVTNDPFETKPVIFEVVDIKDGYVQFKSLNGHLLWSKRIDIFLIGLLPLFLLLLGCSQRANGFSVLKMVSFIFLFIVIYVWGHFLVSFLSSWIEAYKAKRETKRYDELMKRIDEKRFNKEKNHTVKNSKESERLKKFFEALNHFA